MTLHATRDGAAITVSITCGRARFTVTEDAGQIAHFWGELGELLRETGKPQVPYLEVTEPAGEAADDMRHPGDDG